MRKRIDFAKMVLTSQDLTMKNSFVLVQWHGESSVRGNLIDDLKSDTRETASVTDNRFKIIIAMKLFVGNLSFDITERTLRELFEPFGTVSEVKLIMDRETGQSRGFGFVTIDNGQRRRCAPCRLSPLSRLFQSQSPQGACRVREYLWSTPVL